MLSDRQKMILGAIVEDYVLSAEPVGSRALSKHDQIQYSAATIRNEMADLEELGYLAQPHTSAGRVPSQKGYRFYVDHLLEQAEIDLMAIGTLRQVFRTRMDEVEQVLQETAKMMSHLTQYTSIVLGPQVAEERIRQVQLIPLVSGRAVAILVTTTGHVQSRQIRLPENLEVDDFVRMVNLLNAKLVNTPLTRVRSKLTREVGLELANALERYEGAIEVLDELSRMAETGDNQVFIEGASNMLSQPEFRDVDKVRPLLAMFERHADASRVLPTAAGLQVRIGRENDVETLQDCTVISTAYSLSGIPVGRIGVVGPTRMNYAKVMQILDYTSEALSRLLSSREPF